jgi:fibronectin type 3 domain-containing protein
LTYEEMRSTTPPAPLDFRLTGGENSVRLDWSLPPSVEIPHQYSDVIIHYNVYRRTGGQAGTQLIAATENLFYVDESVTNGMTYSYSVGAVHAGPLEGERTDELSVSFP